MATERTSDEIEKVLRGSFRRAADHPYEHPDSGLPPLMQRIGAPCLRCGRIGSDHIGVRGETDAAAE